MKPFFTILLDSYRGLKSETIFWITLGLSVLVAVIFLSIGIDDDGISFLFGAFQWNSGEIFGGSDMAGVVNRIFYLMTFSNIVAGFWLTFIATILALISCASIFPDTMKEGTAGMLLTKKPSRLLVFFAKLTGSLLFVFVQVGLFVVIVFFAFRWRLGVWNFSVFWYVPAVLLVFLNLYSVMVLIGVKTTSVLTSILVTMLVWGVSAGLNFGINSMEAQLRFAEMVREKPALELAESPVEDGEEPASETLGPEVEPMAEENRQGLREWIEILETAHLFLPKNGPIMEVAEEKLVLGGLEEFGGFEKIKKEMEKADDSGTLEEASARNSKFNTIGSSFVFCAVMLTWAAWSFCRREI